MKVAVLISGQLRTFKKCWNSIYENIIVKFDADVFLKSWDNASDTYWNGNEVDNDCTPEEAVNMCQPKSFLIEPFNRERFLLKKYERLIDENYKEKRIVNCLSMYYNIYMANRLKTEYEQRESFQYDYSIRIRPDCFFEQEFTKEMLLEAAGDKTIVFPINFNYCGLNDQLAWGGAECMDFYSDCYNNIDNLYNTDTILHPETLLKAHLKSNLSYSCKFV